jgi:hypothetical protein
MSLSGIHVTCYGNGGCVAIASFLGVPSALTVSRMNGFQSKSKSCYDRLSVGQSILVSSPSGAQDEIFVTLRQLRFVDVGRPLCRKDRSVFYNCCWPSPAQSFLGPSPAGLMTIFYCLRFESPHIFILQE